MNILSELSYLAFVPEDMVVLGIISGLVSFVITLLWLVIGWRAMRAHERIADTLAIHFQNAKPTSSQKNSNEEYSKKYRTFLNEVEEAKNVPFLERQVMFKEWLTKQQQRSPNTGVARG